MNFWIDLGMVVVFLAGIALGWKAKSTLLKARMAMDHIAHRERRNGTDRRKPGEDKTP